MSFQPFLVGDYRAGLQTNLDPWKLPGDAFQVAENMDLKDGIISRRRGYRRFAQFTNCLASISSINVDGTLTASTITGVTQANPGVVTTSANHNLSNGMTVAISGVAGMTELNGNVYTVANVTATTFELSGINTTGFTAYTSGGTVNPEVQITTHGTHALAEGQVVSFVSVGGTTELNHTEYTVGEVATKTFSLSGTDVDNFSTYTSGGTVLLASENPIMGFILHRDSNDDEDLLVADTSQIGVYNTTNDVFTALDVQVTGITTTLTIGAANPATVTTSAAHNLVTGDIVRLSLTGGASTEADGYIVQITKTSATAFSLNGVDGSGWAGGATTGTIHTCTPLHGDSTNFVSWVNYRGSVLLVNGNDRLLKYDGTNLEQVVADFSGATTNDLNTAKHVFILKERVILLSPTESGTAQKQRARFSVPTDIDDWHDQNSGGTGGFVDAPTGEPIVSAAQLQDNLIVFFRKSTWMLRYTGNAILPFRWELISSTRKVEAQFGTAKFDKFVTAVGTTGILGCNGSSVERIDAKIDSFVQQINADKFTNIFAYKFEETERLYITYVANQEEYTGHALIYAFDDQGWTTHQYGERVLVSAATQADPCVITTETNHGLNNEDRISFEDIGGMTELNGNVYVVQNKTDTTFELEGVDSSGFTAYTSGGSVIKAHGLSALGEWIQSDTDQVWQDIDDTWDEMDRVWNDGRFQVGAPIPLMGDSEGQIWELNRGGADAAVDVGADITGLDFKSTLRTKRFNPFLKDGQNAELSHVDILFSRDSTADVRIRAFVDAFEKPYIIDGAQSILLDLASDFGQSDRLWKRVYLNVIGDAHELELTTEGQDKFVEIHAMIFWMRPAGRLDLHA